MKKIPPAGELVQHEELGHVLYDEETVPWPGQSAHVFRDACHFLTGAPKRFEVHTNLPPSAALPVGYRKRIERVRVWLKDALGSDELPRLRGPGARYWLELFLGGPEALLLTVELEVPERLSFDDDGSPLPIFDHEWLGEKPEIHALEWFGAKITPADRLQPERVTAALVYVPRFRVELVGSLWRPF